MDQFNKDLMAALVQKQDLNEIFSQYLEQVINALLQHELAASLDYEPYYLQGFNSGNSRNGSYQRTFKTRYSSLNLTIPRYGNGNFNNHTLPAYQRQTNQLETTVIQLYHQ